MLLRELFENTSQTIGIIFGRFNPPHKGHKAAWEMASNADHWFVGTNQNTQGPKDPLPFDVKIEAMKTIWPPVADHIVAETSWLTLASRVYEKYGDAQLFCFTDEDWVTKTIQQYNGKEGLHGFYAFSEIKQIPTPRLSSATALRNAVSSNDKQAFSDAAGVPADILINGVPFFDLVAHYLNRYSEKDKIKKTKKIKEPQAESLVTEVRRTNIGRSIARQMDQSERRQGLTPLSDIEFKISKYVDDHIDAYQQGRLDADTLGQFLNKVRDFVTRKYRMDPTAVKTVIDYYVNNKIKESVNEAAYEGNIGIMELFKFFNEAQKNKDFELINRVKELIQNKKNIEVWGIVQDYLGTKLIGKEFGG